MADPSQIPYLLKLLDDDSAPVREAVLKELQRFGPTLEAELADVALPSDLRIRKQLQDLLLELRRRDLRHRWREWTIPDDPKDQLESALTLIAGFQNGPAYPVRAGESLDRLAEEYSASHTQDDPLKLARFLFREKALLGAQPEDYANPVNSNIVRVIERKRGIPITLACIYMLVGHRLGMEIGGCNFPGHFLALATVRHRRVVVDCYNGGRVLSREDLAGINASITLDDIFGLACSTPAIVARVLRNLTHAYTQIEDNLHARLMAELLHRIPETT